MNKLNFVSKEFLEFAKTLESEKIGNWGVMNAQQMVEHVADFFKVSYEKIKFEQVTPPEHLPKLREFLWSEKEFRENTKAPMLPETAFAVRNADMNNALMELEKDINNFFNHFKDNESSTSLHPVFGELNFKDWIQLHFKHTQHHAKQFGLI